MNRERFVANYMPSMREYVKSNNISDGIGQFEENALNHTGIYIRLDRS